jgi:hypothetical protein
MLVYQRVDDLITTAKWQFSTSQFALVHYVVDPAVKKMSYSNTQKDRKAKSSQF